MVSPAITTTPSFICSLAPIFQAWLLGLTLQTRQDKTSPTCGSYYVQIHKMYWYVDSSNHEHNGQNNCMFIALAFTLEEAWARENHCGETKSSCFRILGESRQVEVNPSSSLVILTPLSLSIWTLLFFGYIHHTPVYILLWTQVHSNVHSIYQQILIVWFVICIILWLL